MRDTGIYLGVDGGRTGTRALLIDARGTVLGAGRGGDANHAGQGYVAALGHVADAVLQSCRDAGIGPAAIAAAFFGLAGDDVEDDHRALLAGLQELLPGERVHLGNDVWAGLRAGSVEGDGLAINCGSGCGAVGRTGLGIQVMIPDLGYIYGDSGGGGQIAVDAVRAVIRAWDGRGAPTALTPLILDLTGQPDVPALYLALYRGTVGPRTYYRATPLVFQAAADGDAVAEEILRRIGEELGLSGAAIARRLKLQDTACPLVLTGGAFRTLYSPLARAAIARVQREVPRCRPTLPLIMPVAGACLLALDAAGQPVGEGHFQRLRDQGYDWHAAPDA